MYYVARIIAAHIRFHSVVVSTLDFESNNTSSNLVRSVSSHHLTFIQMR